MASSITLKAIGLMKSPNQLDVEPGSLSEASNIIIRRDNVVEPRRGYKLYGNQLGSSSDRAKQLLTYKNRILRHFASTLEFDTGSEDTFGVEQFSAFSGSYLEAQTGLRIKGIESNGNFYFTTSEGIKKISAKTTDQFSTASGFITQAGGIKAVDVQARIKYQAGEQTGFLPADSAVAYRIVWGTKDNNSNLILGTPSQRVVVYNSLLTLMLQDFNILLGALDYVSDSSPASLISDANYVSTLNLPVTASAADLRTNLLTLVQKIDTDILYANDTGTGVPLIISSASITTGVCTINFSAGDPTNYLVSGSNIELSGFAVVSGSINGPQVVSTVTSSTITFTTAASGAVTVTGSSINSYEYEILTQPSVPSTPATHNQLIAIQTYISDIMLRLQVEPTTGTPPTIDSTAKTAYIDNLNITTSSTVILNITIPDGITENYFYQVYRSDIAEALDVAVLSTDVFPNDEMKLVFEAYTTATDISNGFIELEDITPDAFRGANLYTNAQSGEGILQANDVPPFALDINRFKNVIFYANTRTRHRQTINLLGVANMVNDYGLGLNSHTFTSADVNTSTDTITINNHGYSLNQSVEFSNSTPSNLPGGLTQGITHYIINPTTNTFQVSLTKDGSPVNITSGGTGTHTIKNQLPEITISDGILTTTYTFVTGLAETTTIQCVADVADSLNGKYFTINSANDYNQYYVWYKTSGGTESDPAPAGKTGIKVLINTGDTANNVASKTKDVLNIYNGSFTATVLTDTITVTNIQTGDTTDAADVDTTFNIIITQNGRGENAASNQVLLSTLTSPAQAVDETARSLVHVINMSNSSVYAYYLSSTTDAPGKIFLEKRSLEASPFYIVANNSTTGTSFNPDISPSVSISTISMANPTIITTSSPHNLINKDQVVITNSNSTPSIDGLWEVTVIDSTNFSINVNVTVAGTTGSFINAADAVFSDNEVQPHRIYYSKIQQPEAVPIVNFMDVGAQDKAILRIFPLRDSLFVFKEDGLFRISGEIAPFNLALFDGSCDLKCPDSVALSNNLLYGFTSQGIVSVSESGVNIVSRPIDIDILKLASQQYTNFRTATWGIGYESDNSYTFYTIQETTDTIAQIGYRFSTLTNSWTTFDKTATCGVLNQGDDRQYLGAGDTNYIEQERKNFNRLDYSDRQFDIDLTANNYFGNQLRFVSVAGISEKDVAVQEPYITPFEINTLLNKLDLDSFLSPHDYFSILEVSAGASIRDSLDAVLDKIALDTGRQSHSGFTPAADYQAYKGVGTVSTITSISADNPTVITTSAAHNLQTGRIISIIGSNSTPSVNGIRQVTVLSPTTFSINVNVTVPGTTGSFSVNNDDFRDIQTSYNGMISLLNSDLGVGFTNYLPINEVTTIESIVTDVSSVTKTITLANTLDFIVGPITIYKAYESAITWCPQTFGDSLSLKHIRESTVMFENKAFTNATLSFASDLLPALNDIPFTGTGPGLFGFDLFGTNFFGGGSHAAPFRTYIPRPVQRCRFLIARFSHKGAREFYSLYGLTLTGETQLSTRAFR